MQRPPPKRVPPPAPIFAAIYAQVNPGVQGRTAAIDRRNDAKDVPQHYAQLRSDANIKEVRGPELHRKAGDVDAVGRSQ